jgi:hypothetical protein
LCNQTTARWNAIVDNGGEESACGWCKDRWGFSWQITPRVLLDATTSPDPAAAKRAFEAMMPMKKIVVAAIEAALRGETVDALAGRPSCRPRPRAPASPQGTLRERQREHARPRAVIRFRAIPHSCAAFVPAASRSCPRFPARW